MRNANLQSRATHLRRHPTDAERLLWQKLRNRQLNGCRFRRQAPIANYVVDFVCFDAMLVVELDGGQHQRQAGYDLRRTRVLEGQGFVVLRFWNDQVFLETSAVLEQIWRALQVRCVSPGSLPPS